MRLTWQAALWAGALCACGSSRGGHSAGAMDLRDGGSTGASAGEDAGSIRDAMGASAGGDAKSEGAVTSPDGSTPTDAQSTSDGSPIGPPTTSSWLGTNIAADLPRVDITYQLSPFDTAAAQLDANGYPVAGATG